MQPWIPQEAVQVMLTLFLCFLIGLERTEQHARTKAYHFGGIRTYPLLGLTGFILTKLCPQTIFAVLAGLLAITPFLALSYHYKLTHEQRGFTSEIAGVIAYLAGALVGQELYWIAATVVVLNVLLLQTKEGLEKLGKIIPSAEINILLQFLILTAVLLPIVPNEAFTRFQVNPFKIWLVVVAVCGISYGSYLLQWIFRSRESVWLSALLGGAYSSTATTVVMAKKAKLDPGNGIYPYAILAASSLMYTRVALLLYFFSQQLFCRIGWYFIGLSLAGILVSYGCIRWKTISVPVETTKVETLKSRNPLEFSTAFIFAGLFVLIFVATRIAAESFGHLGTYVLAVLMGFVDVDVFIVSVIQGAGGSTALHLGVMAVVLVTASNNIMKGIYAVVFGDRRTGFLSLVFLLLLTAAGTFALLWV